MPKSCIEISSKSCPHCHSKGYLRLHGKLKSSQEEQRGSRVLCSNRFRLKGCGRTCSILASSFISNSSVRSLTIWKVISLYLQGLSLSDTRDAVAVIHTLKSVSRWRKLFELKQSIIRSDLLQIHDPPDQLEESAMELTLKHLLQCFHSDNPIANYQEHFQKGWPLFRS